jgi:lysophospholipase L1-like esterase
LVTAVLGALVLVEIILRVLGLYPPAAYHLMPPHHTQRDIQTHWDITYSTNSLGLRGGEHDLERPDVDGFVRIVVIGDSMAFGQGVELSDAFPEVLERLLVRSGHRAEVINVSQIGVGAEAYYVLLKEIGLRYEPDLVVLTAFGNDAFHASDSTMLRKVVRKLSHHLHLFVVPRMFNARRAQERNARVARSPEALWNRVVHECAKVHSKPDCEDYVRGFRERYGSRVNSLAISCLTNPRVVRGYVYTEPEGPGWRSFEQYVGAMADLCQRRGCRMVVGIVPDAVQVDPGHLRYRRSLGVNYADSVLTEDRFQSLVAGLTARIGVGFFDPLERFREKTDGLYYESDTHMTAAGHRFFAENLLAYLEAEGYLD